MIAGDLKPDSPKWNAHLKRLFAHLKMDNSVGMTRNYKERPNIWVENSPSNMV